MTGAGTVPRMLTRRRFISGAGAATAAVVLIPDMVAGEVAMAAKKAGRLRSGRFSDGVISGDPTPNAITLWTRVDAEGAGTVALEVARDHGFSKVVARREIPTSALRGHTAKARVTGLKAYEDYYYRFATRTTSSRIGRFRTALPADSEQPVRFAFFSCQEYAHGYYNAHAAMAKDDLDFVVGLGDYIYAEEYHSAKTGTAVRKDRVGVATTLDDYRGKYRLYRSDENLQAMHARFPFITTWDDHEVLDNYAGGEADGGLPAKFGFSAKRKRAGYEAFFENMPYTPTVKNRLYRGLRFGKTVDLVMMDQRQYRDNQPCNDAVAPACADYDQPRNFLGREQMTWVKNRLASTPAAWKIMGNELTMMPTKVLGDSFFTFDGWQGYPREREELLTHIRDKQIKDVVFITGDIHTFIAGDVRTNLGKGDPAALEFVGGSITMTSLGETDLDAGGGTIIKGNDANPKTAPSLIDALRGINPWVDVADFDHHGYGRIEARKDGLTCDLVRMATIKKRTTATVPGGLTYRVKRGQTSIKGVNGPA